MVRRGIRLFRFLFACGGIVSPDESHPVRPGSDARISVSPFNVNVMLRQQTFAPDDREIGVQLGITALRYGNVEVRTISQFFGIPTE